MPQNDVLRRYLDAGLAFTAMTQSRAEELVQDLVRLGELRADQAREAVAELVERSVRNSERLLEMVRAEVRSQIASLGLVDQADLDRIEARITALIETATAPAKQAVLKAVPPRNAPTRPDGATSARKASAKKAPAKNASAKKAPAKKAAAKKAPAKKAAAKKASASAKTSAKKAPVAKASKPAVAPEPTVEEG